MICLTKLFQQKRRRIGYILAFSDPTISKRDSSEHQHYLRSLPLHPTQKEIFTCKDYADFELALRPTYDFIMELLSFGAMIEVMEPQSLRLAMKGWVSDMWELYEND